MSRSWLYRQADLRQQIDQLRQTEPASTNHAAEGATQSSGASLRARLNQALERDRQLADDNARLRSQLAQALGENANHPAGCAAALLPSRFHNDRTLLTVAYAATAVTSTTPSST